MKEYIEGFWHSCVREVKRFLEPEGIQYVRSTGISNLNCFEECCIKSVIQNTTDQWWKDQWTEKHWQDVLAEAVETSEERQKRLLKTLLKSYLNKEAIIHGSAID